MRISGLCLVPASFLVVLPLTLNSQTAQLLSHTVITANPPDSTQYEKTIGNFTNPSYPSYFLGTDSNGYVYDTTTGQNCSLGVSAEYYERSRAFTYPGDQYAGVIASLYTSVAWLENPLNWGGSLCGGWQVQPINSSRGAHDLHIADLDGDGKLDVIGSGSQFPSNISKGFIVFQNNYNSWVAGTFAPPSGDGIDVIRISGVNGGARTNLVSCNPSNNSMYWYQNPGKSTARTATWKAHLIASKSINGQPACTQGVALATVNIGNRDIVVVASSEIENNEYWSPGLGYYDPGTTPNSLWTFHQIDSTVLDVHQIASDILNGTSFFTIGEQEQASTICNGIGYNDHGNTYNGCRVAVYAWSGSGFAAPAILSNLGTHNQYLYQLNGVEYMAGANHDEYQATDHAYNLWTFNFGSGGGGGTPLSAGTYNIADPNTGNRMDLGWALNPQWGDGSYVYLYTSNTNTTQNITFTSSGLLQSAASPTMYLYNEGGFLGVGSSGDTFSILSSGSGYTIQDKSAGLYVNSPGTISPPNKLALSSTPTVWSFSSTSGGGGGGLAKGKPYTFQDVNGFTMDLGWALNPQWGYPNDVYLYNYTDGATQQLTYTTSGQLQSVQDTTKFLGNQNGVLGVGASGDTFTITASGSGYTIHDDTSNLYVNSPGQIDPYNSLPLTTTPTVWTPKAP